MPFLSEPPRKLGDVGERLLRQAERVRVEATLGLDQGTQSARGQYFTPERAAALIAGLPHLPHTESLRVLDPGAGTGMLTAALVDRVRRHRRPAGERRVLSHEGRKARHRGHHVVT